ncbi:MAG: DUF5655 domain-containing protein [Planctomycetota bacterium]
MPDLDAATQSMIRNLEEKTGKSLAQWVKIAKAMGDKKHGEVVKALKADHGLGHGYANLVAHSAKGAVGPAAPAGGELLAAQYAGDKAALRPIHDKLAKAIARFGKDVEFAPKKAYVSVRRNKQFAILQPSTKTRFDVGIQLKGVPPKGRLEKSGSWNAMVSHRVRLESAKDVDAELIGGLEQAYEAG